MRKPWNTREGSKPWNPHNDSGKPFANATRLNGWFYQKKEWKHLRANFLKHNPFCVKCEKKGRMIKGQYVDHEPPLTEYDGTNKWVRDALNPERLQTLCKRCHSGKTNKEIANRKP